MHQHVNSGIGALLLISVIVGIMYFSGRAIVSEGLAWSAISSSVDTLTFQLSQ